MYLSTSTSTEDFSEMYLSTFQVLYKLYLSKDVLKYKVLLPGSVLCMSIDHLWVTFVTCVDLLLFSSFSHIYQERPGKQLDKSRKTVEMTVDARSWLHKFQVVSLGRDNPSRNVDANMTIEYSVEGLHHMVLTSSF